MTEADRIERARVIAALQAVANRSIGFRREMDRADRLMINRGVVMDALAALNEAPAQPAIPAGMKPWSGRNSAPEDWDGGPVLWRWLDGRTFIDSASDDPIAWVHTNETGLADIIAYTPKPAQPAGEVVFTGHRFGSPPEPVVNPSADWCDAYADWYYQGRG